MVPWPIALLTLLYGALAALELATVWKSVSGAGTKPVIVPLCWLALSAAIMFGLPLRKPWARRLAVWGAVLMLVSTLGLAAAIVASGRPGLGLAAAAGAGVHVLVIRYLGRPAVRAYFTG